MSTIVAVARDGVIAMAGDTLASYCERPVLGVRKVLRLRLGERRTADEALLGVAGDLGLFSVVRSVGPRLDAPPGDDDEALAWAESVSLVVTSLAVDAKLTDADGQVAGEFLLGWRGRLWTLSHAGALFHDDGVAAIGSGEGPAIGALDALLAHGAQPAEAVVAAVNVAAHRNIHTGGPVQLELLGSG